MAITVDREPLLYPTSIIAALKMLFMSYYVFNICYPTEVQATMEYIQRYSLNLVSWQINKGGAFKLQFLHLVEILQEELQSHVQFVQ